MVSRAMFIFLLVSSLCVPSLNAQVTEAGRRLFRETKAKADKGDAQSQWIVGGLYSSGTGVKADPKRAVKYYTLAAEQGLSQAQFQLALHYLSGDGTKVNEAEAVYWFTEAAKNGIVEAELELGRCYLSGKGLETSGIDAVKWFRKAAEHGSPAAEYYLGKCYFDGTGVSRNIQEGLERTRRAAEAGFALAQNALGNCYERGTGLEKDYLQAYKWYALAAAQDDANAPDIRVSMAKVETSLTKEQVAEAQRLAREFKPSPLAGPQGQVQPASPITGLLTVTADDDSCEVFANGRFVGNTPARLNLQPGPHVIEVKKRGYKEYRREITMTAGSDLNLRATLEKE